MPRKAGNRKPQRRARKAALSSRETPASAIVYRGPLNRPASDSYFTILLSNTPVSISTNASGSAFGKVDTTAVSSSIDWGTLSPNWAEYRILGFKLQYTPHQPDSTVDQPVGFIATIHQSGLITPVGVSSLANVPGRRFVNFGRPWTQEWKMAGSDESGFQVTSSTVNNGGIAWAADNGPISTVVGYFVPTFMIQFRSQN